MPVARSDVLSLPEGGPMIAEMDEKLIENVLKARHIGHIGCLLDGEPYVVPITYVYDNGYIYGHSNEGAKVQAMRQHPQVCFEVDDIDDMTNWRTVVANGRFEELTGPAADRALDLLVGSLAPEATSETFFTSDESLQAYKSRGIQLPPTKGIAYRIKLDKKTGRCESRLGDSEDKSHSHPN